MSRCLTRRAVVAGVGAALGAAALPAGTPQSVGAEAAPAAFDAAAFVAELRAIRCVPYLSRSRSDPGRMTYGVASADGFGDDFRALAQRWEATVRACPDHARAVVAYLVGGAT